MVAAVVIVMMALLGFMGVRAGMGMGVGQALAVTMQISAKRLVGESLVAHG
jgi:hypothetical protein